MAVQVTNIDHQDNEMMKLRNSLVKREQENHRT